jgi:ABC-type branched-subunit amino acid transport system substrate-binding protein
MNRKALVLLVATILLVGGVAYYLSKRTPPQTGEPGVIKIAALLNLTGAPSRFDAIKRATMELAERRLEAKHPSLRLDLQVYDAGGSPETTSAAIRRALESNPAYILTGTSPNALAVAASVRGRIPPIVQIGNAANPDFGPPRPGEYRFWPDWNQEAAIVADLLRSEQLSSVLLIHSADPYSRALKDTFRNLAASPPAIRVSDLQYDPADTPDFRPALKRAISEGTAAVIIFGLPPGINALMAQLVDAGWTGPLIGGVNTNLAADTYDTLGLKIPLWVVQTEAMSEELPAGAEAAAFRRDYVATNGQAPPFHALYLADAIYFAASARLQLPDPEVDEVTRAASVNEFDGASGRITVLPDRTLRFVMNIHRAR